MLENQVLSLKVVSKVLQLLQDIGIVVLHHVLGIHSHAQIHINSLVVHLMLVLEEVVLKLIIMI